MLLYILPDLLVPVTDCSSRYPDNPYFKYGPCSVSMLMVVEEFHSIFSAARVFVVPGFYERFGY